MKTYLYTHKGKPVASKTEEPDKRDFIYFGVKGPNLLSQYLEALKDYEDNLMEVENVFENRIIYDENGSRIGIFILGNRAEIEITENGCIVKSLI